MTFPVVPAGAAAEGWESGAVMSREEGGVGGMLSVAPPPDSLPPLCEHEAVRSANVAGE